MSDRQFRISRRLAMGSTLAAGAVFALPGCSETSSTMPTDGAAAATWTRSSVTSAEGKAQLATYKLAIEKMLALPPSDPRNWYRQAILHLIDCPHGNWWFFNWHRPFIGYFEEICRELTGDDTFALPYWDWTADPSLPGEFWGADKQPNYLDPGSSYFYQNKTDFMAGLSGAVDAFWAGLTALQKAKLAQRHGATTLADLKAAVKGSYAGGANARGALAQTGKLNSVATKAVALSVLQTGLAATDFDKPNPPPLPSDKIFNSPITADHSKVKGFEVIEGQPHNNVHDSIGGLMARFLSPVDPIFWLHHANIDRIWTVWDQIQNAAGRSDKPSSGVAAQYYGEEYLFFVNGKGAPVTRKITASDYMSTASFDYAYAGGSQVAGPTQEAAVPGVEPYTIEAEIQKQEFSVADPATANVAPQDGSELALNALADADLDGIVRINFTPIEQGNYRYNFYLSLAGASPDLDIDGKDYVGTFVFFGTPHMIQETPITISLKAWLADNQERVGEDLTVHFNAEPTEANESLAGNETGASRPGRLNSVALYIY